MNGEIGHVTFIKKNLLFDENGKLLITGIPNGLTVEKVLRAEGYNGPVDSRIYRGCQISINYIMRRLREAENPLPAGSVGRNPTVCFVAANPTEKRLMFAQTCGRGVIGHLKRIAHHGRAIGLDVRAIERTTKQIEEIKTEQEGAPAVKRLEAELEEMTA